MRAQNPSYPNFLDTKNPVFSELTTVLDNLFKTLRSSGVGVKAKHTEGITSDEEDKLWETNVLNIDTPLGLLRCKLLLIRRLAIGVMFSFLTYT